MPCEKQRSKKQLELKFKKMNPVVYHCYTNHPYDPQIPRKIVVCRCHLEALNPKLRSGEGMIPFQYPSSLLDKDEPKPCKDENTLLGRLIFGQLPRITGRQLLFVIETVLHFKAFQLAFRDGVFVDWLYNRQGKNVIPLGLARLFVHQDVMGTLIKLLNGRVVFTVDGFMYAPPEVATETIQDQAKAQYDEVTGKGHNWPQHPMVVELPKEKSDYVQRKNLLPTPPFYHPLCAVPAAATTDSDVTSESNGQTLGNTDASSVGSAVSTVTAFVIRDPPRPHTGRDATHLQSTTDVYNVSEESLVFDD